MAMNLRQNQAPLYIKVNETDNTAIIVNDGGLPKGTVFSCGLVLEEDVPQGHKVALTDLNQGDEIVRYGEVIGFADETIKRGIINTDAVWPSMRRTLSFRFARFKIWRNTRTSAGK